MFNKIKEFFFPSQKKDNSQETENTFTPQPAPKAPTPFWVVLLNTLFPTISAVVYVCLGVFMKIWHPTWLIFFLIPLYYSLCEAIEKKNMNCFAYPVLIVGVYLLLGFLHTPYFRTCWVIIFTIPVYYFISVAVKKRSVEWIFNCIVPILCIAAYLLLGFLGGWWHPGWVVFFAIPLYYQTVAAVKKYRKERKNADYYSSGKSDHSKVETMTAEEYENRRRHDDF